MRTPNPQPPFFARFPGPHSSPFGRYRLLSLERPPHRPLRRPPASLKGLPARPLFLAGGDWLPQAQRRLPPLPYWPSAVLVSNSSADPPVRRCRAPIGCLAFPPRPARVRRGRVRPASPAPQPHSDWVLGTSVRHPLASIGHLHLEPCPRSLVPPSSGPPHPQRRRLAAGSFGCLAPSAPPRTWFNPVPAVSPPLLPRGQPPGLRLPADRASDRRNGDAPAPERLPAGGLGRGPGARRTVACRKCSPRSLVATLQSNCHEGNDPGALTRCAVSGQSSEEAGDVCELGLEFVLALTA